MRFGLMTAIAAGLFVAACAQQEEPPTVYYPVSFDKYGNVVGGTIVDGYFILPDGTVAGPVSPSVAPTTPGAAPGNQSRTRTQAQVQTTTTAQTQARSGRP